MRLEITRKADLALRAIIELDTRGQRVRGEDLATAIGATAHFLPQVMKPVVDAGWVTSEPGPGGGYALDVSAQQISVLELIESIEGKTDSGKCVLRGTACPAVELCALHEPWQRARNALLVELDRTPISTIHRPVPAAGGK